MGTHAGCRQGAGKKREREMRVDTLMRTFVKEREEPQSKTREGKIRVKQIESALDVAQRYYRSSKEWSSMYLLRK